MPAFIQYLHVLHLVVSIGDIAVNSLGKDTTLLKLMLGSRVGRQTLSSIAIKKGLMSQKRYSPFKDPARMFSPP